MRDAPGVILWGYDDLNFVERFLDGSDFIAGNDLERWAAPQASAIRNQKP